MDPLGFRKAQNKNRIKIRTRNDAKSAAQDCLLLKLVTQLRI